MEASNVFSVRQQMLSADFELFHNKDSAVPVIDFHSHDFYEIYAFIEGSVTYFIEEKKYDLLPGDILIIPPGQVHRPVVRNEGGLYERIVLWVNPSYIASLSKDNDALIEVYRLTAAKRDYLYRMKRDLFAQICTLGDQIVQEQRQAEFASTLMIDARMMEMLILLSRPIISGAAVPVREANHIIPQLIAYLNTNYRQKISMDELSREFYISKSHLLREFKKYTQCTINDYIIMKRMAYVKQRISEGVGITQASLECGFSDYSNFYKTFSAKFGFSPNEYKKLYQK